MTELGDYRLRQEGEDWFVDHVEPGPIHAGRKTEYGLFDTQAKAYAFAVVMKAIDEQCIKDMFSTEAERG